jgi:hypothetical protein
MIVAIAGVAREVEQTGSTAEVTLIRRNRRRAAPEPVERAGSLVCVSGAR